MTTIGANHDDANAHATRERRRAERAALFLDYDKEELDAAYDQAQWASNQGEIARRTAQKNG